MSWIPMGSNWLLPEFLQSSVKQSTILFLNLWVIQNYFRSSFIPIFMGISNNSLIFNLENKNYLILSGYKYLMGHIFETIVDWHVHAEKDSHLIFSFSQRRFQRNSRIRFFLILHSEKEEHYIVATMFLMRNEYKRKDNETFRYLSIMYQHHATKRKWISLILRCSFDEMSVWSLNAMF